MSKYPIEVEPSIYQYDEFVFVWFDETGGVGGATNYLEEARRELHAYANYMFGIDSAFSNLKSKQKRLDPEFEFAMYENVETLYEE